MADKGEVLAGRFAVREILADGRISSTLLAKDTDGSSVLIREVRMEAVDSWDVIQRVEKRYEQYRGLRASSLPECIGLFTDEEADNAGFLLVFEYVEGVSLTKLVENSGRMADEDVQRMLIDILEGLVSLHGCEPAVVHGGIRPSMVVKTNDGSYRLCELPLPDLPAVPSTSPAQELIDEGYIPGEQRKGRESKQSDLYSLGMTAAFAISGIHPHLLPTKRLRPVFREGGNGSYLDRVIESMIEPDLAERADSAAALLDRISYVERAPEPAAPANIQHGPESGLRSRAHEVEIRSTARGDEVFVKNPLASRPEALLAGFFLDLWVSKPWLIIIILAALSAGPLLIPLLIFWWHPKSRTLINRAFARFRDVSVTLGDSRLSVSDQLRSLNYSEIAGYRLRENTVPSGIQLEVIVDTKYGKEQRFYINGLDRKGVREIKDLIERRLDRSV